MGPRRGRRSLRLGPRRRSLTDWQSAEFGGSILKNNMEVEEAMELQWHLSGRNRCASSLHHDLCLRDFSVCTVTMFKFDSDFLGLHHV